MDLQLDLQMGRFSVHSRYFYYFQGVMAGAWRTPVSGYFSCSVFWDPGKRNMLTTVFNVPNAHHIFGRRHSSGGVRVCNPFLTPFGVHFLSFRQTREIGLSDPNGLARESLNLNPWILEDLSTCRYIGMSICRYVDISVQRSVDIGIAICRYVDKSGQLPAPDLWIMEDLSIYLCRDMSIYRFVYIGLAICRYVDIYLYRFIDMSICRYVDISVQLRIYIDILIY